MNKTCAAVWQLCNGSNSISEISHKLCKMMNLPANEEIVWFALDQLKKEKLIENNFEGQNSFVGLSRREVVKRVGLGSMIELPFVLSLIAPSSIMAQSGCFSTTGVFSVNFSNTTKSCGGHSQGARNTICQNNVCLGAVLTCINTGPPKPDCTGGTSGLILTCTCS